ncbi:MAG: pseudouridine synthase [Methylibium sp.]|uniref:16S rRNA pseudouridine(516) synthase n=1 Tax=Methylibium sp. TaxID=2067992 RepID=UPI00181F3574|nr:16S rRNA pseudouridine(516) synthase [Methylibium sp.]MBA3596278.1 pseudouridine synthase [Methylibium sp.]
MRWSQVLFSQGFGTRRECEQLILGQCVKHEGRAVEYSDDEVEVADLEFEVEGRSWLFRERALLLLNKPVGYECSQKPKSWPSVLTLLPPPLRSRGVQPIGRLDQDTTGVLLLTDDGTLIHRVTHPKHHVPKVYEAQTAEPVTPQQIAKLLAGVTLKDESTSVRAAACEVSGERSLRLTLTEGKYHQVKRMIAAAGNHVLSLHRSRFGPITLPADLAPGQWRWLDESAREQLASRDAPAASAA